MNSQPSDSQLSIHSASSAIDPVCGMTIDPAHAAASHVHAGVTYFFCAHSCLERFKADPDKYVAPQAEHSRSPSRTASDLTATTTDPVCGMSVLPGTAAGTMTYAGQQYHFCSIHCQQKFVTEPEKYTNRKTAPATPTETDAIDTYTCPMHPEVRQIGPGICPKCGMGLTPLEAPSISKIEYVCPMHPEVVSDHPGSCPKCGMALEPRTVEQQEGPNHEQIDMTRRFWVGLLLGLPVFLVAMADMLPGNPLHR